MNETVSETAEIVATTTRDARFRRYSKTNLNTSAASSAKTLEPMDGGGALTSLSDHEDGVATIRNTNRPPPVLTETKDRSQIMASSLSNIDGSAPGIGTLLARFKDCF